MSLDTLLEACRQAPDDDAPRLVWADAVGGERGELVVIQCDLARGGLTPAATGARLRRERQLLNAHAREWTGFEAFMEHGAVGHFRRGFVESISLTPCMVLEYIEEIFQHAPLLRSLTTGGWESQRPLDALRQLLELPAFWGLDGLDLRTFGIDEPERWEIWNGRGGSGDEAVRLLVESGMIKQLRALGIRQSGLTSTGLQYLTRSTELEHLERLRLSGAELDGDVVLAVLARAPRLKSLELQLDNYAEIVPALPSLTDLYLPWLDDQTLDALGRSHAAASLERVRLERGGFMRGDGFRAFPRLRLLDLGDAELVDPVRALAGLPALRRLSLRIDETYSSELTDPVLALVRALGPQLEQLWLRLKVINELPRFIDELRRYVAGDILNEDP